MRKVQERMEKFLVQVSLSPDVRGLVLGKKTIQSFLRHCSVGLEGKRILLTGTLSIGSIVLQRYNAYTFS